MSSPNRKRIKWQRGRPLMVCPECGSNSGPDHIDFRKDKPAILIMKCLKSNCGKLWAIEIDKAKAPDGTMYELAKGVNVT